MQKFSVGFQILTSHNFLLGSCSLIVKYVIQQFFQRGSKSGTFSDFICLKKIIIFDFFDILAEYRVLIPYLYSHKPFDNVMSLFSAYIADNKKYANSQILISLQVMSHNFSYFSLYPQCSSVLLLFLDICVFYIIFIILFNTWGAF